VQGGAAVVVENNDCPWYAVEYAGAPGGPYPSQIVLESVSSGTVTGNSAAAVSTSSGVINTGNTVLAGSGTAPTPATLPLPQ
jgi:hypothetical protein